MKLKTKNQIRNAIQEIVFYCIIFIQLYFGITGKMIVFKNHDPVMTLVVLWLSHFIAIGIVGVVLFVWFIKNKEKIEQEAKETKIKGRYRSKFLFVLSIVITIILVVLYVCYKIQPLLFGDMVLYSPELIVLSLLYAFGFRLFFNNKPKKIKQETEQESES